MADESIQGIPGFGKIDYTLKFYLQYLEKIRSCLRNLVSKGKCQITGCLHAGQRLVNLEVPNLNLRSSAGKYGVRKVLKNTQKASGSFWSHQFFCQSKILCLLKMVTQSSEQGLFVLAQLK